MYQHLYQLQKNREKDLQQRKNFAKTWIGQRKLRVKNIKEKQAYFNNSRLQS